MKKTILLFFLSFGFLVSNAQIATDFTAMDCSGNSYNLFSDLDEGKIVVITWTMPCGACVPGALTAYNITQSYEANYPGKVKMLLVDDFGNTPCSAINSWANSNALARTIKFSDASIRMNDYGIVGMPKTIAIAPDHSVIFNENNGVNPDSLQAAIDAVLTTTSIKTLPHNIISTASVYPNPAGQKATVKLDLIKRTEIEISIFDLDGKKLYIAFRGDCLSGENLLPIDLTALNNGLYQVRIGNGDNFNSLPLLISK